MRSSDIDNVPAFCEERAFYIGLNKIRDVYNPEKDLSHKSRYALKAKAELKADTSGLVGAGIGVGIKTADRDLGFDLSDRHNLLAIAPSVFSRYGVESQKVDTETNYEIGRAYHYTGSVRFRIRTHDDWREPETLQEAPRIGLWLLEIPDSEPCDKAQSVTWVLLSGTAKGQLKTDLGGSVSDWRGGSGTEGVFELMAKYCGAMTHEDPNNFARDWVYSTYCLLQESSEQNIETLFYCFDLPDIRREDNKYADSGWSLASTNREVPVSRLILGTPYFVQTTPTTSNKTEFHEVFRKFFRNIGKVVHN
ncbi:hypothetical protein ACOVJL_01725 [Scardovia wiggsiae]|uniref:hypothetical protein n=1 Tax=Scardovia wiggsiae TaxID=230143 RepID=UPI00374F1916